MRKIYDARDIHEAYLLLGMLQEAGIAAQLQNEFAHGATGEIPFTQTYPEIWLENESDCQHALKLIRQYENTKTQTGSVFCPSCAEENPDNFEVCWKCAHPLR